MKNKKADIFVASVLVRLVLSLVLIFAMGACAYKLFMTSDDDLASFRALNQKIAESNNGDVIENIPWKMRSDTFAAYFSAGAPAVYVYESGSDTKREMLKILPFVFLLPEISALPFFMDVKQIPLVKEYLSEGPVAIHRFDRPAFCPREEACACLCRKGAASGDDPVHPSTRVWEFLRLREKTGKEYALYCDPRPQNLVCESLGKKQFPLMSPFHFFPKTDFAPFDYTLKGYWANGYIFFRENHFESKPTSIISFENYKDTIFICKDKDDGFCAGDEAKEIIDKQDQQKVIATFQQFLKDYEICSKDENCNSISLPVPADYRILHSSSAQQNEYLSMAMLDEIGTGEIRTTSYMIVKSIDKDAKTYVYTNSQRGEKEFSIEINVLDNSIAHYVDSADPSATQRIALKDYTHADSTASRKLNVGDKFYFSKFPSSRYTLSLYEDYTLRIETQKSREGTIAIEYYQDGTEPSNEDYVVAYLTPFLDGKSYFFKFRPNKPGNFIIKATHYNNGAKTGEKILPVTIEGNIQADPVNKIRVIVNTLTEYENKDLRKRKEVSISEGRYIFLYNNAYTFHITAEMTDEQLKTLFPNVQVFFMPLETIEVLSSEEPLTAQTRDINLGVSIIDKGWVRIYLTALENGKNVKQATVALPSDGVRDFPKPKKNTQTAHSLILQYLYTDPFVYEWKQVTNAGEYVIPRCTMPGIEEQDAIYTEGNHKFNVIPINNVYCIEPWSARDFQEPQELAP